MKSLESHRATFGADEADGIFSSAASTGKGEDASIGGINSPCSARLSPELLSRVSCPPEKSSFSSRVGVSSSREKQDAAGVAGTVAEPSSVDFSPLRCRRRCLGILLAVAVSFCCLCVCVGGCSSAFVGRVAASLFAASSSRIAELREVFHFYCLRPTGGADAARAMQSAILILSALYLPGVFLVQWFMRHRRAFRLKWACVSWNFLLSFFSATGFMVMLVSQPSLVLRPILPELEFTPPVRAVICIFTLTKAVEYGDTALLVFRKKPLTFLHLYHHLTVTLYCWHAQLVRVSVGHYFAFLNLIIHSWMYLYYGLSALYPSNPLLRTWRPLITVSQILQMCVGLTFASYALTKNLVPEERLNAFLAVGMYVSYAILFVKFFINAYFPRSRDKNRSSSSSHAATPLQLLVLIHLLAAAGLYLLLTHSRRSTLLLEILSFSAATAVVLPFVIQTHRKKFSSKIFGVSHLCCMHHDTLSQSYRRSSSSDSNNSVSRCIGSSHLGLPSSDAAKGGSMDSDQTSLQNSNSSNNSISFQDSLGATTTAAAGGGGGGKGGDNAISGRETDTTSLSPHRENLHCIGSNGSAATMPLQQQQQQSSPDKTFRSDTESPACGVIQTPRIHNKEDVCHEDCCAAAAAAVKASAARPGITVLPPSSSPGVAAVKPQQQGMQQEISAVSTVGSLLPVGLREQPQNRSSSSSSMTSPDSSCRQCTVSGTAAATAAALQEMLHASSQQEEKQRQTGERQHDSGKAVCDVSNNNGSSSSSYSPCLRSNNDCDYTEVTAPVSSLPAAAAADMQEKKRNLVIGAAQRALQGGGQTVLTISNFLLAYALKRLMDVQEAAAAAAAAGRTAGDVRGSKGEEEEATVARVAADSRHVADAAGVIGATDIEEKIATIAATRENCGSSENTTANEMLDKELDEEIGIQRVCQSLWQQSNSGSSAELILKAQQLGEQQQRGGAVAAGDQQLGNQEQQQQQQVKDFSAMCFCEENSTAICCSPGNLRSDVYTYGVAGKSTVTTATDTDSTGVQTAASSRAAEETSCTPRPSPHTSSRVCDSLSYVERLTTQERSEGSHSENQLGAREEEEKMVKELLLRDADSVITTKPSPAYTQKCPAAGRPATAALKTREETSVFGALAQQQLEETQQQQQVCWKEKTMPGNESSSEMFPSSSCLRTREMMMRHCTNQEEMKKTTASARVTEVLLAATCAGVPAFYGWLIHGNALLGLCVHGALRWLLELYTSRTFYSSGRRRMFAVTAGGTCTAASPADKKMLKQQ